MGEIPPPPPDPFGNVDPPEARRKRWPAVLVVGVCLLILLVATGVVRFGFSANVGDTNVSIGSLTYANNGVSFDYPAGWVIEGPLSVAAAQAGSTNLVWEDTLGPPQGTKADLMVIDDFATSDSSTLPLDRMRSVVDRVAHQMASQIGARITSDPEDVQVDGRPAFRVMIDATIQGVPMRSTVTFLPEGTEEYTFNCQATQSLRATMAAGCDQITSSFAVAH